MTIEEMVSKAEQLLTQQFISGKPLSIERYNELSDLLFNLHAEHRRLIRRAKQEYSETLLSGD